MMHELRSHAWQNAAGAFTAVSAGAAVKDRAVRRVERALALPVAGKSAGPLTKSFSSPAADGLRPRKRGHTAHSRGFASSYAAGLVAKRLECAVCPRFGLDFVNGSGGASRHREIVRAIPSSPLHHCAALPHGRHNCTVTSRPASVPAGTPPPRRTRHDP